MRIVFSAILLILSVFFTINGLDYSYTTNTGQAGPGFLPRWIGILLVIFTSYNLFRDIKEKAQKEDIQVHPKGMLAVVVITGIFIFSLNILGALLSMILYFFVLLLMFNKGRLVQNTLLSTIVPICIYLILDVWLNAGLPKGIITIF
jgi:putative tricarboxylic transport membrane protein